ncbi:MAG TPA: hypothetical protein VFL66_10550 [Gaiellaceae bacterium]|nr:hypothetical protein [Gaiellaceae bacterium]
MAQREEESLIDEMREAIRGDRERAAARGAAAPPQPPEPPREPEAAPPKGRLRRLLGR